uniref:Pentacotripeptide-repeat region of PRORP domain-containing protein n=1 Tax=Vitrella brassicaformis TaxID=1169539 RepID=A0A7S1KEG5_9ALVE
MVNALLDACDKAGEWERAVDILTQLKETPFPSLRPDHRSFNSVISACSKNGQMDLAFSFTLEMQTYGFRPNEVTYHALVFAADDRLRPPDDATADVSAEELDNFLGDVYDSTSDAPDPVAYGAAIASCRRRGDWKQAFSILREMKGHGLTPTSFCYTATLQTLIAAAKSGRYTGDGEGEGGGEGAASIDGAALSACLSRYSDEELDELRTVMHTCVDVLKRR